MKEQGSPKCTCHPTMLYGHAECQVHGVEGARGQGPEPGRRIRVSSASHGGTEVHCNLLGASDCEGFPSECDHCAGWQGWGLEIKESKPAQVVISARITVALCKVPPEQLPELDPVAFLKEWAAEFKAEMENDPAIGPYVRVSIDVEEGQ